MHGQTCLLLFSWVADVLHASAPFRSPFIILILPPILALELAPQPLASPPAKTSCNCGHFDLLADTPPPVSVTLPAPSSTFPSHGRVQAWPFCIFSGVAGRRETLMGKLVFPCVCVCERLRANLFRESRDDGGGGC